MIFNCCRKTMKQKQSKYDIIQETDEEKNRLQFGWKFFQSIFKLISIIFRPFCSRQITLLALLLIVGSLSEILAYHMGIIPSQYYTVLTSRDAEGFKYVLMYSMMLILSIAVTNAIRSFIAGFLAIEMREILTSIIHMLYFHANSFYVVINFLNIDNPDQRFVQDINSLCTVFTKIAPDLVLSPFVLIFYTYKTVIRAGWLGTLFVGLFFFIFTIINRLLVPWVAKQVFEIERQEGYFRFLHAQLRVHVEQAAFSGTAGVEYATADCSLRRLLAAQQTGIFRNGILTFATNFADYFGILLVYFALGTAIFGGFYDTTDPRELMTIISEAAFFFFYLINKCTTLLDMAIQASQIAGLSHRLVTVLDHLETMHSTFCPAAYLSSADSRMYPSCNTNIIAASSVGVVVDDDGGDDESCATLEESISTSHSPLISHYSFRSSQPKIPLNDSADILCEIKHLSVQTPTSPFSLSVKDLSICIRAGKSLLITGPSGSGKTSLLRILAGLWPTGQDAFTAPGYNVEFLLDRQDVRFLPQRPYLPPSLPGFVRSLIPERLFSQLPLDLDCFQAICFIHLLLFTAHLPREPHTPIGLKKPFCQTSCCGDSNEFLETPHWSTEMVLQAIKCLHEFRLIDEITQTRLTYLLNRTERNGDDVDDDTERLNNCSVSFSPPRCPSTQNVSDRFNVKDWRSTISPGEAQRLAMARLCYQSPRLAILDEATSQLSEPDEQQAYTSLVNRGITLISVGHRTSLRAFHKQELQIIPGGSWQLLTLYNDDDSIYCHNNNH